MVAEGIVFLPQAQPKARRVQAAETRAIEEYYRGRALETKVLLKPEIRSLFPAPFALNAQASR